MDELDLNMSQESIIIGRVSKEVLQLLKLSSPEKDIILWKDRLKYLDKHIPDFPSIESFEKHIKLIPSIIQSPDFVGIHPKGDSIQYIKRIDEIMLIGIRINKNNSYVFRSAYPISQEKFDIYLNSGSIKKI